MKNKVWFIEWKCDNKWIAIDYENRKIDVIALKQKYQKLNSQYKYRIKKYVREG